MLATLGIKQNILQQAEQQTGIQELKPDTVVCVEKTVKKLGYYLLPVAL